MHFDIAEVIRQKQQKQPKIVSIENGNLVDISVSDGAVVVSAVVPPEAQDETGASE